MLFVAQILAGCGQAYRPIVVRTERAAPVVAITIAVVRPADEFPAMAHLIEHLFLRGTVDGRPHRPRVRIAEFGGLVEARTGPDLISWSVVCPARDWPEALGLLMRGFRARWSALEIEQALRVIEAERRLSRERPEPEIWRTLATEVFRPSGCEAIFSGWPISTDPLTPERLARQASRYLLRARTLISAVGPVERDALDAQVEAVWTRMGSSSAPREAPTRPVALRLPRRSRGGRVEADGARPGLLLGLPLPDAPASRGRDAAFAVLASALPRASYRRFLWGGMIGLRSHSPAEVAGKLAPLEQARDGAVARWLLRRESAIDRSRRLLHDQLLPETSRVDPVALRAVSAADLAQAATLLRSGPGRYWLGVGQDPPAAESSQPAERHLWRVSRPRDPGRPTVEPLAQIVSLGGWARLQMFRQGALPPVRIGFRLALPEGVGVTPRALGYLMAWMRSRGWRVARSGNRLLAHRAGDLAGLERLAENMASRPVRLAGLTPRPIPPAEAIIGRALGAFGTTDRDPLEEQLNDLLSAVELVIVGPFDPQRAAAAAVAGWRRGAARHESRRIVSGVRLSPARVGLRASVTRRSAGLGRLLVGYRWPVQSLDAVTALEAELRLWSIGALLQGPPALYRVRLVHGRSVAGWGFSQWEFAGSADGLALARSALLARLELLARHALTAPRLAVLRRMIDGEQQLAGGGNRARLAHWFDPRASIEQVDGEAVRLLVAGRLTPAKLHIVRERQR